MAEKKEIVLTKDQMVGAYQKERQKFEALDRQKLGLRSNITEIDIALKTLETLEKGKQGEELLVSIGAGVLVEATLKNNARVKSNLPGNIVIDCSIEEARQQLDKRKEALQKGVDEIKKLQDQTVKNLNSVSRLLSDAEKFVREARAKKKEKQKEKK